MQICVRLPNWLGDVIMSLGFLHTLRVAYPDAAITVIIKKGLEPLLHQVPDINEIRIFSKDEYSGVQGVWKYGKELAEDHSFDLFFVLPDSASSAMMAMASGAKKRIGFRNEGRSLLLTHAYRKPSNLHRAEEYAALIKLYNAAVKEEKTSINLPAFQHLASKPYIVVNINSEAVSRRMPAERAALLIEMLQRNGLPIVLIGSAKEQAYVSEVLTLMASSEQVKSAAGSTNLLQLTELIQGAALMVSTDSGPAHIASASKVPLVVMFGAGDENNTGPYQNENAIVVRNGALPCEPCVKNFCKLAPLPLCMMQLDLQKVKAAVSVLLKINQ